MNHQSKSYSRRTKMTRVLHLTNDQFDVLYDVVEETIFQIRDGIEDTDLELDDYDIYQVWKNLNKLEGKSYCIQVIFMEDYSGLMKTMISDLAQKI